jgi:phosphohistidine phosphatase SixA
MRLFLLRHEERGIDYTFKSILTQSGKYRASTSLKTKLEELNINKIYCSPFIRTLQTIEPYAFSRNINPNIEYALCEDLGGKQFEKYKNISLSTVNMDEFKINKEYDSLIDKNTIRYPESEENVKTRIATFLEYLNNKHCFIHENILLCTHQSVVNMILNELCDPTITINDEYPMGGVCIIEDNKYKGLNF